MTDTVAGKASSRSEVSEPGKAPKAPKAMLSVCAPNSTLSSDKQLKNANESMMASESGIVTPVRYLAP